MKIFFAISTVLLALVTQAYPLSRPPGCRFYVSAPSRPNEVVPSRGWSGEQLAQEKMEYWRLVISGLKEKGYRYVQDGEIPDVEIQFALYRKSDRDPFMGPPLYYAYRSYDGSRPAYLELLFQDLVTGDRLFINESATWYKPGSVPSAVANSMKKVPVCPY